MSEPDWCSFFAAVLTQCDWAGLQEHSAAASAAASVLHSSQGRTPRRLGRRRSGQRDVVCRTVIPLLAFTGTSTAANNSRPTETNPLIPPAAFQSPKQLEGWAAALCHVKCGPPAQESIAPKPFGMQMGQQRSLHIARVGRKEAGRLMLPWQEWSLD